MDASFLNLPFGRVLVARPRHHALGLLIVDVLIALHVARNSATPLVLLRGERGEDAPLLHVTAAGVERLDGGITRWRITSRGWTVLLMLFRLGRTLRYPRNLAIDAALLVVDLVLSAAAAIFRYPRVARTKINERLETWQKRLDRRSRWHPLLERWKIAKIDRDADPRERALKLRQRTSERLEAMRRPTPPGREVHHGYDVRRLSAEHPLTVEFAAADEERARAFAAARGLLDGPFITLHVRDGGSKRDPTTGGFARDVVRDARIESYFAAIDALVALGYRVARIGDPEMTPLSRPGVVDVATDPEHELLFDLWCVKNCHFFIAGDSGPYMLSWLFNVPCLAVNITNVLGVFPLRRHDLYVIKCLEDVATQTLVPLAEMLTDEFLGTLRRRINKEQSHRYVDNSAEDIRDAALEMAAGLNALPAETSLQREYRERVACIRNGPLVKAKLHEKAGIAEVFLGAGRVSCAFVERHYRVALTARGA